mmetsp:Transcript_26270/g.66033  ORF Transcript_26270/g.66033 Transcript_26270/m.66033 type:complete len:87 (+) Transcript_26270:352-612(+)
MAPPRAREQQKQAKPAPSETHCQEIQSLVREGGLARDHTKKITATLRCADLPQVKAAFSSLLVVPSDSTSAWNAFCQWSNFLVQHG